MAKKKKDLPEAESKQVAVDAIEEVETVTNPVGHVPAEQQEPVPTPSAPPRVSAAERQRLQEEAEARRILRQDQAMVVGKYITAFRRNNILKGTIAGVEIRSDHAFWIIYDDPVVVKIPFKDALPEFLAQGVKEPARQRAMMSKVIGAEIPFAVKELVEPDSNDDGIYYVYGSRLDACERLSKRYFGEDAVNPVKRGDELVGTIMSVGAKGAWVSVNGVDTSMPASQLSHRYLDNLMEHYNAGEQIRLSYQRFDPKPKRGNPNYIFSALPCELEECKSRHWKIHKGDRFVATITSHRVMKTKNPVTGQVESYYAAAMWLEGIDVPAYANVTSSHSTGKAHSGDKVTVEVNDISQSGYVRCRIVAYLPK